MAMTRVEDGRARADF